MRRHFPLFFTTKQQARQLLALIKREHPDATLEGLRRSNSYWAGCITTDQPLDGGRGLLTRGRCRH
jgi:hypothetical protein